MIFQPNKLPSTASFEPMLKVRTAILPIRYLPRFLKARTRLTTARRRCSNNFLRRWSFVVCIWCDINIWTRTAEALFRHLPHPAAAEVTNENFQTYQPLIPTGCDHLGRHYWIFPNSYAPTKIRS